MRKLVLNLKKKVRKFRKRVWGLLLPAVGHLKFRFRYVSIAAPKFLRFWSVKILLSFTFLSFAYFGLVLFLGVVTSRFLSDLYLSSQILTYFITVAAMIGGILAIVFSFKTLIMQNAADHSAAGFYRLLAQDRKQDAIFFVLVFSILGLIVLSLTASPYQFSLYGNQINVFQSLIILSILIVGTDLYLVFLLNWSLFKSIDPFHSLEVIVKSTFGYLDKIEKDANQLAGLVLSDPKITRGTTKEEVLAVAYQRFLPNLQNISYRLDFLFDFHEKFLARNEKTAALSTLESIASILIKYFDIRKSSSLMIPTQYFFVSASDSQGLITPHLEKLVSVGESYLKKEDSIGIRKVLDLFKRLILAAGEIKFVRSRTTDNPIFTQCRGYLAQLVRKINDTGSEEGMFRAAINYGDIGLYALKNNMVYEVEPIFLELDAIAFTALKRKSQVVVSEVLKSYLKMMPYFFSKLWRLGMGFDLILEHVQKVVLWSYISSTSGTLKDNSFQLELAKPFEVFGSGIIILARDSEKQKGKEREASQRRVLAASESLRLSLRYLAENFKSADSIIISGLSQVVKEVGSMLIKLGSNSAWKEQHRELKAEAEAYIHLLSWFTYEAGEIEDNHNFDSLTDTISFLGLIALENGADDLAEVSLDIISKTAVEMLEKEKGTRYGFTEPRIMLLATYIGIYAQKIGKQELVKKAKIKIKEFDAAYQKKWFSDPRSEKVTSPNKNQLMTEVLNFMDNLGPSRIPNPYRDSFEFAATEVTREAVAKFVEEVWAVKLP